MIYSRLLVVIYHSWHGVPPFSSTIRIVGYVPMKMADSSETPGILWFDISVGGGDRPRGARSLQQLSHIAAGLINLAQTR